MLEQSAANTGAHPAQVLVDAGYCSDTNLTAATDRHTACGTDTFMATGPPRPPATPGRVPRSPTHAPRPPARSYGMIRRVTSKPSGTSRYTTWWAATRVAVGTAALCAPGAVTWTIGRRDPLTPTTRALTR